MSRVPAPFTIKVKYFSNFEQDVRGWETPDFQRLLDKSRCEEIWMALTQDLERNRQEGISNGVLWCSPDITIAKIPDKSRKDSEVSYWILDGQHRLYCFKRLYEEKGIDVQLILKIPKNIHTYEDAQRWFEIVNRSQPLPELPGGMAIAIPNTLALVIEKEFPSPSKSGLFSPSLRHHIPRLNMTKLVQEIAIRQKENPIEVSLFTERLRKLNAKLSKKDWRYFESFSGAKGSRIRKALDTCRMKCGGCYVGMIKDYMWLDELYGNKIIPAEPYKKQPIPKCVKDRVWEKHFPGQYYGACYLCGHQNIDALHFEAGHDLAERNGGQITLDNLFPICSSCNRSQGTRSFTEIKNILVPTEDA
jgi:5-methylcytosine-specific restriction endonuclease McrA